MQEEVALPQPYRFINKVVQNCVSLALETILKKLKDEQSAHKFSLPRHMPVVSGSKVIDIEDAVVTCWSYGATESVFGLRDGTVRIYRLATSLLLRTTPVLFDEPVGFLHCGTPFAMHNLIAAASKKEVRVLYLATPSAPRKETVDDSDAALILVTLCSIPSASLGGKVAGVHLSDDGAFLAVTLGAGEKVAVFTLPPFPELTSPTPPPPASATLLITCTPPSWAPSDDRPCFAMLGFAVRPTLPMLGYFREGAQSLPLAFELCIAWRGLNVFSRYALRNYTPYIEANVSQLKEAQKKAPSELTGSVSDKASPSAPRTGGKGGKESSKAPAPAAVPESLGPQYPQAPFFSGHCDTMMPQVTTSVALSPSLDRFAIGCMDGIVNLWSASLSRMQQCFNLAPHRVCGNSVNVMVTNALKFCEPYLIASVAIPSISAHGSIVIYSMEAEAITAHLQYLSDPRMLLPLAPLPLLFVVTNGLQFILDVASGKPITEVHWAEGDEHRFPFMEPLVCSNDFEASLTQAGAAAKSVFAHDGDCFAVAVDARTGEKTSIRGFCAAGIISATYPALFSMFSQASLEELVDALVRLPHESRREEVEVRRLLLPDLQKAIKQPVPPHVERSSQTSASHGPPTQSEHPRSQVAGSVVSGGTAPRSRVFSGKLSANPNSSEVVQFLIDQREVSRGARKSHFNQLWKSLKAN